MPFKETSRMEERIRMFLEYESENGALGSAFRQRVIPARPKEPPRGAGVARRLSRGDRFSGTGVVRRR
jgi:hypothetical protein